MAQVPSLRKVGATQEQFASSPPNGTPSDSDQLSCLGKCLCKTPERQLLEHDRELNVIG